MILLIVAICGLAFTLMFPPSVPPVYAPPTFDDYNEGALDSPRAIDGPGVLEFRFPNSWTDEVSPKTLPARPAATPPDSRDVP